MASAVNEAADRVGNASQPDSVITEAIESLKRTRQYALGKGMAEVVAKCDRILEILVKSNARA